MREHTDERPSRHTHPADLRSFQLTGDGGTVTFYLFNTEGHPSDSTLIAMGQPKRKQSKQRSHKRRGANQFEAPQVSIDPTDGSAFLPHRVNPENGMYRGRQVIDVKN